MGEKNGCVGGSITFSFTVSQPKNRDGQQLRVIHSEKCRNISDDRLIKVIKSQSDDHPDSI